MLRNQDAALDYRAEQEATTVGDPTEPEEAGPSDDLPDFGQMVQPIALKSY